MNVDEPFAQRAQRLRRHRLAVDIGAPATVARHDAAQDALAAVFDRLFVEPRARVSKRSATSSSTTLVAAMTIGRSERVCGQIGTSTSAARLGCTIGPPQESAYAVEPVDVATMKPSPPCVLT